MKGEFKELDWLNPELKQLSPQSLPRKYQRCQKRVTTPVTNMNSPQKSPILDTVDTLKLKAQIHYILNVSSSATHPPAKCPKTAANLKAGLIISDLVTDALRLDSN